jgi:hypothetical protein
MWDKNTVACHESSVGEKENAVVEDDIPVMWYENAVVEKENSQVQNCGTRAV